MRRLVIGNTLNQTSIELGLGLPTRMNFIVGTNSGDNDKVEAEKEKIDLAAELGVDTITDLSMVRLGKPLWKYVKDNHPSIGVGINPPYLPFVENNRKIEPAKLLIEIRNFIFEGGDHMTINFFPRDCNELYEYSRGRKIPITSRQGGILAHYMSSHEVANPYYEIFDEMIDIVREYNVTINIGSTFRPAGIAEANDRAHNWETYRQMEMHRKLNNLGVQSIVEAMSHQPLATIGSGILELRKDFGSYIPFQFLGPVTTDVAGPHDHIASCIGAAEAARYNVGKVTTIPAREHTGFPTLEDVRRGIIAAKIAVHAGDGSRLPELMDKDREVLARRSQCLSCDPDNPQGGCDKCAEFCPILLFRPR